MIDKLFQLLPIHLVLNFERYSPIILLAIQIRGPFWNNVMEEKTIASLIKAFLHGPLIYSYSVKSLCSLRYSALACAKPLLPSAGGVDSVYNMLKLIYTKHTLIKTIVHRWHMTYKSHHDVRLFLQK